MEPEVVLDLLELDDELEVLLGLFESDLESEVELVVVSDLESVVESDVVSEVDSEVEFDVVSEVVSDALEFSSVLMVITTLLVSSFDSVPMTSTEPSYQVVSEAFEPELHTCELLVVSWDLLPQS